MWIKVADDAVFFETVAFSKNFSRPVFNGFRDDAKSETHFAIISIKVFIQIIFGNNNKKKKYLVFLMMKDGGHDPECPPRWKSVVAEWI